MNARLHIKTVLWLALQRWWRDFAPITILGLALLLGTELIMHAAGAIDSSAQTTSTLVATVRAFAFLLFFSAVTTATLASRGGLPPGTYILTGLSGAQPPLVAGLTAAAGLICVLIIGQLLALFIAPWARLLILPPLLLLGVMWLLVMPVAAAEKKVPFAAMRRSQNIARTHLGQICGLAALVIALLMLPLMVVAVVIYGYAPTAEDVRATMAAMTPGTAGFWVRQLAIVILSGAVAVIPPAIYIALSDTAKPLSTRG